MPTHSCPSLRPNPQMYPKHAANRSSGQVLVIFGLSLLVLLLFTGLAVDAGVLYVSYGQLKRSIDLAAVAAANSFKRSEQLETMKAAALEVLRLNSLDVDDADLDVLVCDADGDRKRDVSLQTTAPEFYARCPDTEAGEAPRKLVFIRAQQKTPFYFLSLIGFDLVVLTSDSTAEAAAIDLVIVIDTSELMGYGRVGDSSYSCKQGNCSPNFPSADPALRGCNLDNSCTPLLQAKDAAKALVDEYMYDGYDQVGVVTFDSSARIHPIGGFEMSSNMAQVMSSIDNAVKLHDDPPADRLRLSWLNANLDLSAPENPTSPYGAFNPVNPEDRDGDGRDRDPGLLCNDPDGDGWDPAPPAPYDTYTWPGGVKGIPCDQDDVLDAYDWDSDGVVTEEENQTSLDWLAQNGSLSVLSTCTGCGIRVASNVLRANGRPGSVWVMILLSDGAVNLSDTGFDTYNNAGDTPDTSSSISASFPNGYCTGGLNLPFWTSACSDNNTSVRYCMDPDPNSCPPDTTHVLASNPSLYSVDDYARDMADESALTRSENPNEPRGNDIAMYTIGLNVNTHGEELLRYIATVGDDGDRSNPLNCPVKHNCGNYYFAATKDDLAPIFENIASRLFTRITD